MKNLKICIRLFISLSFLTGIIYPSAVTLFAKMTNNNKSNGSFIYQNEKVIASKWIGQKFESEKYFWSRPSAVDYNAQASGASNYGQSSLALMDQFQLRKSNLMKAHEGQQKNSVPQDLLFASASGLDPHISPEAAHYQVIRVAAFRKMDQDQLHDLVNKQTEPRQFGVLGEPRVNVVLLNQALDQELQ